MKQLKNKVALILVIIMSCTLGLSANNQYLQAASHVYNIAGDNISVFGSSWNPQSNQMTLNSDGKHSITFRNIPAGTNLTFKIVEDGTTTGWNGKNFSVSGLSTDSNGNAVINIAKNSNLTITYKEGDSQGNYELTTINNSLDVYAYTGNDLGATYTTSATTFKVWAPTATSVELKIYSQGTGGSATSTDAMTKDASNGVWTFKKTGDLNGKYYTYAVTTNGVKQETVDIYAKAVGLNGNRGAILNLSNTNPSGWSSDRNVTQAKITDAIIWETHVKDFSYDPNSGISANNRGKYLAFTENNTTLYGAGQTPTGVNYLKWLGINYVHILPVQDADNDEYSTAYNWNYNPKNYNVPEGSFSSNPANPATRIIEYKQMVQSLHNAGIGIVMDVVYNHTAATTNSWFNLTVPKYYYRTDSNGNFLNGSDCGNETASENAMFRKYMVDSILYWAKEYHIDGFRFDLMGLHDTDTMNAIRYALDKEGLSNVILYGEPWDAGSNGMNQSKGVYPANKSNVSKLVNGIAIFNNDIRDTLKGSVFNISESGFVQYSNRTGATSDSNLINAIKGNVGEWAKSPSDSITYTSAHDNWSLWDKLVGSTNKTDYYNKFNAELEAMNKMAAVGIFTSQGATFFQAGEEFARTKYGEGNSYQSSNELNQLDWSRIETFKNLTNYYKGLARLNKAYSPFRDASNTAIQTMRFSNESVEGLVGYTMQNTAQNEWKTVAVIMNSTPTEQSINLTVASGQTPTEWVIVADKDRAGVISLGTMTGSTVKIAPRSALILVDKSSFTSAGNKGYQGEVPYALVNNTTYNLTGDNQSVFGSQWNPASNEMMIQPDGSYAVTFNSVPAGTTLKFKIVENGSSLGWNTSTFAVDGLAKDTDGNAVITVANESDLTITYRPGDSSGKYILTNKIAETNANNTVYNIAGDNQTILGGSWNPAINEMTRQADGSHAIVIKNIPSGTTLKFKVVENGTRLGWGSSYNFAVDGLSKDTDGNAIFTASQKVNLVVTYKQGDSGAKYIVTPAK